MVFSSPLLSIAIITHSFKCSSVTRPLISNTPSRIAASAGERISTFGATVSRHRVVSASSDTFPAASVARKDIMCSPSERSEISKTTLPASFSEISFHCPSMAYSNFAMPLVASETSSKNKCAVSSLFHPIGSK